MSKKYLLLPIIVAIATPISAQFANDPFHVDLSTGAIQQAQNTMPSSQEQVQFHSEAYYFTSTGKRLQYTQRTDTYVVSPKIIKPKGSKPNLTELKTSLERAFGAEMLLNEDATFKGKIRIEIKPGKNVQALLNQLRNRPDIDYISPLLLNSKGGEVSLSPGVVIRFAESGSPSKSLLSKLTAHGFSLDKQLVFTASEFLFHYSGLVEDPATLFQNSRAAMNMLEIEWAEPNFVVAPIKRFTPNDNLYTSQWHLNNTGQNGGQVGADINAAAGWDLTRGTRTVVAIIDDGVQLNHPDLPIWNNPGESGGGKETDGIDNDNNGFVDDYQGWDFGGADNSPGPAASTDNHGTSVAGVAAAQGNNAIGVSGSASNARILPIRTGSMACSEFGNAIRYAAKYADVVNNSWGIGACEAEIDSAIADAVAGAIPGSRRKNKGTPVLFATGNSASGWINFSLAGFPAGTHLFEWEYTKDIRDVAGVGYDTMWMDDIVFPGGSISDFESGLTGFGFGGNFDWVLSSDGIHARGASGNSAQAGAVTNRKNSIISITKTVSAGALTFWAWVSSEQSKDKMNFYVSLSGGARQGPFFGYSPGQNGHLNEVGYPSSNPNVISIGASTDGGPGGSEERSYYSQFGPELDVLAPSNGGGQGITTTDRTGADGYDASDYTNGFGGTSSATPLTAGVVADIIAIYPHITVAQVREALRQGADEIGPYAYVAGRNDYYGSGRVNLLGSLQWIKANNLVFDCDLTEKLLADRWALIGLPCAGDFPSTVLSVLGDDLATGLQGSDWFMGEKRLVGANNYSMLIAGSAIEPGRGYWVKSTLGTDPGGAFLDDGALDEQGMETSTLTFAECPSNNGCVVIDLNSPANNVSSEWNLVAHPLAFPVDWADARILVDGVTVYVLSAAQTADIVSATYQVWNGSTYVPKDDNTPGMEGTLEPSVGFWVKALPGAFGKDVKLLIPAAPSLKTTQLSNKQLLPWYGRALNWLVSPAYAGNTKSSDEWYTIGYKKREEKRSASKKRLEEGLDWYVRLSVEAPADQLVDAENVFGQLADSIDGFDSHDLKELPPFSTPYLTLVFPHDDWVEKPGDYASDFHSSNKKDEWLFELKTDQPGRDIILCWDGREEVIARSALEEVDSKNKYKLGKKDYKDGCISIYMDETVKRFYWVYQ